MLIVYLSVLSKNIFGSVSLCVSTIISIHSRGFTLSWQFHYYIRYIY